MKHNVQTQWKGKMSFESIVDDHKIVLDANPEVGGEDKGPTPKPLLLTALSGCTGMDIASLLKKMRVEVDDFNIKVEGELTEEHPKHYRAIRIVYEFTGHNLDKSKVEKAVKLSQERYCGVSHMLGQVAELTYKIVYKEKVIETTTQ